MPVEYALIHHMTGDATPIITSPWLLIILINRLFHSHTLLVWRPVTRWSYQPQQETSGLQEQYAISSHPGVQPDSRLATHDRTVAYDRYRLLQADYPNIRLMHRLTGQWHAHQPYHPIMMRLH